MSLKVTRDWDAWKIKIIYHKELGTWLIDTYVFIFIFFFQNATDSDSSQKYNDNRIVLKHQILCM